jgi:hypothetical protein
MEVLMSRSSRRVSRPLIAGLSVVIVLGIVFTIHRVHVSRAAAASKAAPLALGGDQSPLSVMATTIQPHAPVVVVSKPAPAPAVIAAPVSTSTVRTPSAQSALVTQTPVEKASADPATDHQADAAPAVTTPAPIAVQTPAPIASTTPAPSATLVTPAAPTPEPAIESADNDAKGLEQWAKGAKPKSNTVAIAPVAPIATQAPAQQIAMAHDLAPPVHAEISVQPVADAKVKVDAGDLIGARQILNDALIAGRGGDPDAIKTQIEQINQTLVFSARKFPNDPWGGSYQVASGERLGNIAARSSVSWELVSRINNVTPKKLRSGQWIKLAKGPFHAVVTKHLFRMELYLGAPSGPGSMYIRSFPVGLGKDNSTPTGLWLCKAGDKIRNPRYYPPRGGDVIAPDDPKNPLAGYWIAIEGQEGQALGKESYGIHGTIDPDSIGKMESMGCIRLKSDDISWVFDMLVDGKSTVLVKE